MGRKGKKARVSRQVEEEEIESDVDEEMESEVEGEEHQEHMRQSSANEKSLYEVIKHFHFFGWSSLVWHVCLFHVLLMMFWL